jgi:hypothetical protein
MPTGNVPLTAADIAVRLDAVERLTKIYQFERFFFLGVTTVSVLMLLACAGVALVKGGDPAAVTGLFGSSGLITYSTGRILFMWSRALSMLGAPDEGAKA